MKKFLAMLMVFVILFTSIPANAFFVSEQELVTNINNILYYMEQEKDVNGLSTVDFTHLFLGKPIHAYEYVNQTYREFGFTLYPIIDNTELVAFALVRIVNGEVLAQIDLELSRLINEKQLSLQEIAFVYDSDTCYAATTSGIVFLADSGEETPSRDSLRVSTINDAELMKIKKVAIEKNVDLQYQKHAQSLYSSNSVSRSTIHLNVPIITQSEATGTNNICWACCVASIYGYILGENTDLSDAINVARSVHGINYNQGGTDSQARYMINAYVAPITYNTFSVPPTTNTITNKLNAGYPIYSKWENITKGGHHATVIRGVSDELQVISLMNPTFSTYVYVNWSADYHTYSYVSSYSSSTFVIRTFVSP